MSMLRSLAMKCTKCYPLDVTHVPCVSFVPNVPHSCFESDPRLRSKGAEGVSRSGLSGRNCRFLWDFRDIRACTSSVNHASVCRSKPWGAVTDPKKGRASKRSLQWCHSPSTELRILRPPEGGLLPTGLFGPGQMEDFFRQAALNPNVRNLYASS
jgi:hypothetical protein